MFILASWASDSEGKLLVPESISYLLKQISPNIVRYCSGISSFATVCNSIGGYGLSANIMGAFRLVDASTLWDMFGKHTEQLDFARFHNSKNQY